MQDTHRDELRLKQDFLVHLCEMGRYSETFRITDHPGAPKISELRRYLYADWEMTIEHKIAELAEQMRVAVPDFKCLTTRLAMVNVR